LRAAGQDGRARKSRLPTISKLAVDPLSN